MARLAFGSGAAEVILTSDVEALLRGAAERAAPGLLPLIEEMAESVKRNAEDEWPRGTAPGPRSADQFEVVIQIHDEWIRAKIRNKTDYYYLIREKGVTTFTRGHNSFNEHIRKYSWRVVDDRLADLAAYTAELLVEVG